MEENVKLNLQWVADIIDKDYTKWNSGDIVLIECQTGTGKTWFVKNVLTDYLLEHERLLFVCNRTNLKRQLKKDLLNKYGIPIPTDENGNTDLERLDNITKIENIVITSYHAIQNSIIKQFYDGEQCDIGQFEYIILDECHYLMTDGSYNNKCMLAYDKLVKEHQHNSIKIFISATMEEIKPTIYKNVAKIMGEKPRIFEYSTGIDYSYVHPKYFDSIDTIINLIKNDMSEEKWLIFVSKIDDGKYFLQNLGEDICSLIVAGSKTDELKSIINNSKFEKKVLVTTKALDNGINIEDSQLVNIVIMAWDKTTFIQMLGRKRYTIDNCQEINLYIMKRMKKSFISKVMHYDQLLDEINLLIKNPNDFNKKYDYSIDEIGELDQLFYRDKVTGNWKVNKIGWARTEKDKKFFQSMVNKFEAEGENAFIEEQLIWIGLKDTFDTSNLIETPILNEEKESLLEYLERNLGLPMLRPSDRKELIEKIGLVDPHNTSKKKKQIVYLKNRDTLNDYLQKELSCEYYIKQYSTTKKDNETGKNIKYKSVWKIMKLSDNKSNKFL